MLALYLEDRPTLSAQPGPIPKPIEAHRPVLKRFGKLCCAGFRGGDTRSTWRRMCSARCDRMVREPGCYLFLFRILKLDSGVIARVEPRL
jgi:hypothetical protein